MADAFAGEGKTDARDAVVIAQTARLRGDLAQVSVPDDVAIELELEHKDAAWVIGRGTPTLAEQHTQTGTH